MPKGFSIEYTEEMTSFLQEHEVTPRANLTALFNSKFSTNVSVDSIKAKCLRMGLKTGRTGQLEKGNQPWNTGTKGVMKPNVTSFKKGNVSWNKKPVGSERTTKDGYLEVKIAEPNVFELKHRVVWAEANGEIPKDHAIVFKNKDKTDCRLENLMLLTRGELARLNQTYIKLSTPETNEACVLMAKVKNKIHQLERGRA